MVVRPGWEEGIDTRLNDPYIQNGGIRVATKAVRSRLP
jgi:hypothetical protein